MNKNKLVLRSCLVVVILITIFMTACKKEKKGEHVLLQPSLPAQPYTYSNGNNAQATLGRVLFYEKHLSANNSVSCGTCHVQSLGFSDGKKFSAGVANELTRRNTPSITNESGNFGLFWDGRAANFEDLIFRPITNHEEMGIIDLEKLPEKLRNLGYYNTLFEQAYGSDEIDLEKIQNAMSNFLFSLERSAGTKFEQNLNNSFAGFNPLELMGKEIFFGKGNCNSCHAIGRGWMSTANIGLDLNYSDNGISELTGNKNEGEGLFRVPSLINIELTAPYMHDGRFRSLEEVVEHYNSGIQDHKDLSWALKDFNIDNKGNFFDLGPKRLNLSALEKKALVSFLKTLSDWNYVKDIRYSNPFVK